MSRVHRIHLIGIGGVGMSGIAGLLRQLDYEVSGSDLRESVHIHHLRSQGARIHIGHAAEQVVGADLVVSSSAIDPANPELVQARALRIPVIGRAEMLADLMHLYRGIAVAGTHGKTTTTSMISVIFAEAGLDPTFVIGGLLQSHGATGRLGRGEYFIAEADESDSSFLHIHPWMAVITNVDSDHLEHHGGDLRGLRENFLRFTHNLPFYGLLVLCSDDAGAASLLGDIARPVRTYGFAEDSDYRIVDFSHSGPVGVMSIECPDRRSRVEVRIPTPGAHNARNAAAAVAVALEAGIEVGHIQSALAGFRGVRRRLQVIKSRLEERDIVHLDDYGHHPTELAAVFQTVRDVWPERRLVAVFQPHRYSRTQSLFGRFVEVLGSLDALLLLDVYPAGERPIAGAGSPELLKALQVRPDAPEVLQLSSRQGLAADLGAVLRDGDVMLTIGAGDIEVLSHRIAVDGA
ncbi:MAG: UDP-N-acetylmuramate--L-alanine ligase [Gammaproteobacteria bacterium AqS3]|nr:UDP-N-acetylmuramate--L-alanine ligase [Gammaproteobacteria bacterium AqS3]